MIVITDSGPLMALAKLGLLHLPGQLYQEVQMPETVYREVVLSGEEKGYPDSLQVKLALQRGQLVVGNLKKPNPDMDELSLHEGEKAVLSLALQNNADMVLMDDLVARNQAKNFGLRVKGTLGVIVDAYRKKLLTLDEVHIILDDIAGRSDIWISEKLCRAVLDRLK